MAIVGTKKSCSFSLNKRLNLGTPRKCLRVKIAFDLLLRDITVDSGDISKEWTLANISPLFKKADRSLACNYRPVSLTCVPCKLLEHIVCSNIMAHLDEHKLLSIKQHAFRKWHSCETQLATVINDWAKILDNKGQVEAFILDFEKPFDTPQ